jgi:hypothetical protein
MFAEQTKMAQDKVLFTCIQSKRILLAERRPIFSYENVFNHNKNFSEYKIFCIFLLSTNKKQTSTKIFV